METIEPDHALIPDASGPDGLAAFLQKDELDVPRVVVKRRRVLNPDLHPSG